MKLRVQTLVMLCFLSLSTLAFGQYSADIQVPQQNSQFPIGPDAGVTPGSLCTHPTQHRYPENIAYCSRNVESDLKRELIREYDQKFGYSIESMDRQKFKIDHYIPLCAGGSNEADNLWPQHVSVYTITDPLEALICQKMSDGVLSQKDAVDTIRNAKNNLAEVPEIISRVQSL